MGKPQVLDPIGTALGFTGFVAFLYHLAESSELRWSRSLKSHLAEQYDYAKRPLSGAIPRLGNVDHGDYGKQIDEVLRSPGVFALVEGPSSMGKSFDIGHRLKGREFVVTMCWRTDSAKMDQLLAEKFGVTGIENSGFFEKSLKADGRQAKLQSMIENVFRERYEKNKHYATCPEKAPVIVVDDVHQRMPANAHSVSKETVRSAEAFLSWALDMSIKYNIIVVMLTSEPAEHQLKKLSGARKRIKVLRPTYATSDAIKRMLIAPTTASQEPHVKAEDAAQIVKAVGGDMAALEMTMKCYFDAKNEKKLDRCLDECIKEQARFIAREMTKYPEKFDEDKKRELWDIAVFELMEQMAGAAAEADKPLPSVHLARLVRADRSRATMQQIAEALEAKNLARTDGNGGAITFHSPVLRTAWHKEVINDAWITAMRQKNQ